MEKYRKCDRKPENAILDSWKGEKNLRKARKSIFLLRKTGNRPAIPGPLLWCARQVESARFGVPLRAIDVFLARHL